MKIKTVVFITEVQRDDIGNAVVNESDSAYDCFGKDRINFSPVGDFFICSSHVSFLLESALCNYLF